MTDPDPTTDPAATSVSELELLEWRRVRPDRYALVPGHVLLRLVAEIDRHRAEAGAPVLTGAG